METQTCQASQCFERLEHVAEGDAGDAVACCDDQGPLRLRWVLLKQVFSRFIVERSVSHERSCIK